MYMLSLLCLQTPTSCYRENQSSRAAYKTASLSTEEKERKKKKKKKKSQRDLQLQQEVKKKKKKKGKKKRNKEEENVEHPHAVFVRERRHSPCFDLAVYSLFKRSNLIFILKLAAGRSFSEQKASPT